MRPTLRNLLGLLVGTSFLASFSLGTATAGSLTLINGWTNAPFGTAKAGASSVQNVVHLSGAIATNGTSTEPFVLPSQFRPSVNVYVPVDLCNATNGRLDIAPSGEVDVEAEGGTFSNAQCFTSLDGVAFSLVPGHVLILKHDWTDAPFGTGNAAVRIANGVVQFAGAIATAKKNAEPFILPAAYRPATAVYVPVDLCDATNGRLEIEPSGDVTVQAEGGTFSNAQCFTSLDGVSFAQDDSGFTPLTLTNGWTNAPFSTRNAALRVSGGIVQFEGAIATTETNAIPFTLPAGFRPTKSVYVKVDLCNGTNGRLEIQSSGTVTVEAATFSNAQCFTSLEGVSFRL